MGGPWERFQTGGMQRMGPANQMLPLQKEKQGLDIAGQALTNSGIPVKIAGDRINNEQAAQTLRQRPISEKDQDFINGLRGSAGEMGGLLNNIRQTAQDVDTFNTGPVRNFLAKMAIPKAEGSGVLDQIGGWIGNGWFTPQEKVAYQRLQALQNRAVLNDQIAQKGPQTEGDAIRMKLANAGPGNYKGVNVDLLSNATLQARLAQERPNFYTNWANHYGALNAPDKSGQTVDKAWKAYTDNVYNSAAARHQQRRAASPAPLPSGWSIQRIK